MKPLFSSGKPSTPRFSKKAVIGLLSVLLLLTFSPLLPRPIPVNAQGTNLALNKATSADGTCAAGEESSKAVDASNSTKWCALGNNGQHYLQIDLGATASIGSFTIKHAGVGGESTDYNTRNFTLQLSNDGSNFSTAVTVTGNTQSTTTHPITATSGRYVRLNITVPSINDGGQAARIYELEVYAATGSGGTNLAIGKPGTSDGTCNAGQGTEKAVDDLNNTAWCALGNNGQHYLQIDLGASASITSFGIRHAGSAGETTDYNLRDYTIQLSPNGSSNYTTVVTVTGNTQSITTHPITAATGRYVKINITVPSINDGGQAARIYEFQVFGTFTGATATPTATPPPNTTDILGFYPYADKTNDTNLNLYKRFSTQAYIFQTGDVIEYEVYLFQNVALIGGLDIVANGVPFRDESGWADQNGLSGHPGTDISARAYNQWYARRLNVPGSMVGRTAESWSVAAENDTKDAAYTVYYRNIRVTNGGATRQIIFQNDSDFKWNAILQLGATAMLGAVIPIRSAASATNPAIISTTFATEDVVVASYVINNAAYGVDPTGSADSTLGIQRALADCFNAGGGVAWLPAGKYRITGSIHIPNHVTLRGDWRNPDAGSGSYGTVILADVASGSRNDAGLFRLWGSSGVRGLTVYYPNQNATTPVSYPYTFEVLGRALGEEGYMNTTIQNVTLLNAYYGLSAGFRNTHEVHLFRDVKGTALANAMRVEDSADVSRIERVTFKNDYWANLDSSVSGTKPSLSTINAWTRANGVGLEYGDDEWDNILDVTLSDYKTGISFFKGRRINGTANFFNISILNSNVGILVSDDSLLPDSGINLTHVTIQANQGSNPLAISIPNNRANTSILFNDATLDGAVQITGNTLVSFINSRFQSWAGTYAVTASAGTLVIEGSTFVPTLSASKQGVRLNSGLSSATILGSVCGAVNCNGNAFVLDNQASGADVARIDPGFSFAPTGVSSYTWRPTVPAPFSRTNFYNARNAPYNAPTDGTGDATSAIQSALNAASSAGGGTVFLPAGRYALFGNLTIPAGVELRGVHDGIHRTQFFGPAIGSVLYVRSSATSTTPIITVQGSASRNGGGLRGLSIYYPEQASDSAANLKAYPWTIRGDGVGGVYAYDLDIPNAFRGIDFATNITDNHYVNGITGGFLDEGIRVGNASRGWVDGNLMNMNGWGRAFGLPNRVFEAINMFSVAFAYSGANQKAYVVTTGAQEQWVANNFVYGAKYPFTYEGNAVVTAINSGADGVYNPRLTLNGTGAGRVKVINYLGIQINLLMSGGTANVYNVQCHYVGATVSVSGGTLVLSGGALNDGTASLTGGNTIINGVYFRKDATQVSVSGSSTVANLWGNVGLNGFRYNFGAGATGGASGNIRR